MIVSKNRAKYSFEYEWLTQSWRKINLKTVIDILSFQKKTTFHYSDGPFVFSVCEISLDANVSRSVTLSFRTYLSLVIFKICH